MSPSMEFLLSAPSSPRAAGVIPELCLNGAEAHLYAAFAQCVHATAPSQLPAVPTCSSACPRAGAVTVLLTAVALVSESLLAQCPEYSRCSTHRDAFGRREGLY